MLLHSVTRRVQRLRYPVLVLLGYAILNVFFHTREFYVSRPSESQDAVFRVGCEEPPASISAEKRENAVIVMLARNDEVNAATRSIQQLERHFNQWFHYPVVFITGESGGFTSHFQKELTGVASGAVAFHGIEQTTWKYPEWINQERAKAAAARQERRGVKYGGLENYHHMCRYMSHNWANHPALKGYKWYWRIEPGVEFYCAMTYDPFAAMAKHKKVYGYNIALWESEETAPSLFRHVSTFKDEQRIPTTDLWRSMVDASWAPWGLRGMFPAKTQRDAHGDAWNQCHYWGNFEIADMDFFRSDKYRMYYDMLDKAGGFYYERWGDAPVRSLGAALFLEPRQLHYFEDFGYGHPPYRTCPKNAAGRQLEQSSRMSVSEWSKEYADGVGCRCECDPFGPRNRLICLNKLRKGT